MNNIDKLIFSEYLVKQAFLKSLTKMFKPSFKDLMKARRGTHVTNDPGNFIDTFINRTAKELNLDSKNIPPNIELLLNKRIIENLNRHAVYLPGTRMIYLNPISIPSSNIREFISTKRHELIHGMQDSLPFIKSTLAGKVNKIPFLDERFGALANELESYIYQDPRNKLSGIRHFHNVFPYYADKYKGTPQEIGFKLYDKARKMWPLNKI